MSNPRDLTFDNDDDPGFIWRGLRGSRQRVRRLVLQMEETQRQREKDRDAAIQARFREGWVKTNELFAPAQDMPSLHKRLHLPLGRPDPIEPIEPLVDPEAFEREGVPDDYQPSNDPVAGDEHVTPELDHSDDHGDEQ